MPMSSSPENPFEELDKSAMGRRIRQIRLRADLRQWELARLLGTTQSAIHKYEHGVVPEPRRLIRLAQVGGTSIEWVLTGRHWENGSEAQQRLSPELLDTAFVLREFSDGERATLTKRWGSYARQCAPSRRPASLPTANGSESTAERRFGYWNRPPASSVRSSPGLPRRRRSASPSR